MKNHFSSFPEVYSVLCAFSSIYQDCTSLTPLCVLSAIPAFPALHHHLPPQLTEESILSAGLQISGSHLACAGRGTWCHESWQQAQTDAGSQAMAAKSPSWLRFSSVAGGGRRADAVRVVACSRNYYYYLFK